MMKMQDIFDGLAALYDALPTPIKAALLSMMLTILRFVYDDDRRKSRRKWLETAICIAITWGISEGLKAFDMHENAAYLIAVGVGWLGADFVRERAKHFVTRKSNDDFM